MRLLLAVVLVVAAGIAFGYTVELRHQRDAARDDATLASLDLHAGLENSARRAQDAERRAAHARSIARRALDAGDAAVSSAERCLELVPPRHTAGAR